MKTILIIFILLAVSIKSFAFSGGHDSLLFDGSDNLEIPKKSGCTIKLTVFNSVEITSFSLVKTLACGEVTYEKQSVKNIVHKDMDIPVGSEISTGPDGFARIDLEDGSRILMDNNSKITIEDDFCIRHPLIRFHRGSVWTSIKKLLGAKSYEVLTDRAIVGVRGTEFELSAKNDNITVKVYESKVEITPVMNDETNKMVIKTYEQLIDDMQTGKITAEEFSEKSIRLTEIMEGGRQFPSVMVETGNMVDVTFEVSTPEPIPADNNRWFEDPRYNN